MAAPPPAYSTPHAGNPDRRALPEGWITRYDDNYRAWYYVDTRAHPPRSAWDHPSGPPPAAPAGNYPPPSHPPPTRTGGGYNSSASPPGPFQPSQPGQPYPASGQTYPQSPTYAGYPSPTQEQRAFGSQGTYPGQPPYGGNYGSPGNPGWPQQGWQQQPPTQLGYQTQPPSQAIQQPPRTGRAGGGGIGVGTAVAAGAAGLLGGALLTEGFEHHEDRERQEAYEEGFGDGQESNNFDGEFGGDW